MKNLSKNFHSGRAIFSLILIICCILIGAVLKLAASVVLPFTIAILLALVMYPLVKLLDKTKCPRFFSILLTVIIMAVFLYTFGMILFSSGKAVVAQYPKYENRIRDVYIWITDFFDIPYNESQSIWENIWGQLGIRSFILNSTRSFSGISIQFIRSAVLVILFMVFTLLEAGYFKEKLEVAFEKHSEQINRMGHDLMNQITRYLTAKFLISLVNGIVFAVSFSLVGLEFAIVWGVFQFIMNFIPTLGSIVTGFFVSLFALIQFWPEPGPVIAVVVIVLVVNLVLSNYFDPKIIGDHVGISPLMILVSLAIWGYLWGFAGMILAVPMTVIIKIVCENIPILEPVSILLGSRRSVLAKKAENEKSEE